MQTNLTEVVVLSTRNLRELLATHQLDAPGGKPGRIRVEARIGRNRAWPTNRHGSSEELIYEISVLKPRYEQQFGAVEQQPLRQSAFVVIVVCRMVRRCRFGKTSDRVQRFKDPDVVSEVTATECAHELASRHPEGDSVVVDCILKPNKCHVVEISARYVRAPRKR